MLGCFENKERKLICVSADVWWPQAQLIHDRNTASHSALNDKADATPERVHMTWTKEKYFTERNRNREASANIAVRDLFNMKP